MSTHSVNVIRVGPLTPHPNADRLELTMVGGYQCVVPKGAFQEGQLAVFVEPDYVLPDLPQYAFLKGRLRVGAVRLRGVWSEGLMQPAFPGAEEGDDVMGLMGITRYEPPAKVWKGGRPGGSFKGGHVAGDIPSYVAGIPKYDLENLKKYRHILIPGEAVHVTEKLHGTNARYVFHAGRMWCGSRSLWRKEEPANIYWDALKLQPEIREWCEANPGTVLWGELYGQVQDLTYGLSGVRFAAFDLWDGGVWRLPPANLSAPRLGLMPYDFDRLVELAEQDSTFGGVREGLVVEPAEYRYSAELAGRVKLKLVSRRYLERP